MFAETLENLRKKSPVIHCISNYVTINDVANMVYAAGARPMMSDEPLDIEEITASCSGLVINLGMLTKEKKQAVLRAARVSDELGHPMVLDPVGVGISPFRKDLAMELLNRFHIAAVRGNMTEMKALALQERSQSGVDADETDAVTEKNVKEASSVLGTFAKKYNTIAIACGAIDLVSNGEKTFAIRNGEKEMGKITGTGCQLSAVLASFITANKGNEFTAAAAAVSAMGLAGEIAKGYMQESDGNATYKARIIDAMFNMRGEELEKGAKYEIF